MALGINRMNGISKKNTILFDYPDFTENLPSGAQFCLFQVNWFCIQSVVGSRMDIPNIEYSVGQENMIEIRWYAQL